MEAIDENKLIEDNTIHPITKDIKDKIIELYEIGAFSVDVERILKLNNATLNHLINNDSEIAYAKEMGEQAIEIKVIKALIKSACGYNITETKTTTQKDRNDQILFTNTEKSVKHIKPDTNAAKFWLSNRSKSWTNALDEVEKDLDINITIDNGNVIVKKLK